MKKRIISAAILIIILLPIIYFGGLYYYLAIGIVGVLAYKEIISLPLFEKMPNIIKIGGILFFLPIIFTCIMGVETGTAAYLYLALLFVYFLVPSVFYSEKDYKLKDGFCMAGFVAFLGIGLSSLILARESLELFIYIISIAVLSDTFAMLTGSLIGKHKLCPEISPNKTIEGSIGGLAFGTLLPIMIYIYLGLGDFSLILLVMSICLAVFAQLGDLIFSRIKRENKIKDFSNLIPGHGGVLDRLDSIIFVSIIYLIFSSIL